MRPTVKISILVTGLLFTCSVQAQVAISEDGVSFPIKTESVWGLKQYNIGDKGPADGWVFYVTEDGLHGLEAAPADQSSSATWGCQGDDLPGAAGNVIGTGASNTEAILQGCATSGIAARLAAEYVSPSGYFDWYLPSIAELELMYLNLHAQDPSVGDLYPSYYWSSSERVAMLARTYNFWSVIPGDEDQIKNFAGYVRAVRVF